VVGVFKIFIFAALDANLATPLNNPPGDNKEEEEDSPDCNAPDAVFAPCCVVEPCDCARSSRRLELLFEAAMMMRQIQKIGNTKGTLSISWKTL